MGNVSTKFKIHAKRIAINVDGRRQWARRRSDLTRLLPGNLPGEGPVYEYRNGGEEPLYFRRSEGKKLDVSDMLQVHLTDRLDKARFKDGLPRTEAADRPKKSTLRRDVMSRLEQQGRIRSEHLMAVEDIRRIWRAFGRGMFPAARDIAVPRVDGGQRFRDPVSRMTEGEASLYRQRYLPWARWAGGEEIHNGSGGHITLLQLVHDMVIDNLGPRQWEEARKVRHGTATRHLAVALDRYLDAAF